MAFKVYTSLESRWNTHLRIINKRLRPDIVDWSELSLRKGIILAPSRRALGQLYGVDSMHTSPSWHCFYFKPPRYELSKSKKEFASIPVWHPECCPRTLHQTCLTAALPESARLPPPSLPHRLLAIKCKFWWPQTPTSPHVSQATAGPAQKETWPPEEVLPTTRTTFAGNDKKRDTIFIRLEGTVTGFFDAIKAKKI